jgi:hypothetical protein
MKTGSQIHMLHNSQGGITVTIPSCTGKTFSLSCIIFGLAEVKRTCDELAKMLTGVGGFECSEDQLPTSETNFMYRVL